MACPWSLETTMWKGGAVGGGGGGRAQPRGSQVRGCRLHKSRLSHSVWEQLVLCLVTRQPQDPLCCPGTRCQELRQPGKSPRFGPVDL